MIDTVICGDCLEVMRGMDDNSVDLCITSPPYDKLRDYKGYSFDFEGIAEQLFRVTKQGGVVVWVVGDATIKGSETGTSFRQALHFKKIGFSLHDTMIWNKNSCRYPETNRYYPCFEYMFVLSKGQPETSNLIKDRRNKCAGSKVARAKGIRTASGKMVENSAFKIAKDRRIKEVGVRFNVWDINVSATEGQKKHPATFPLSLAVDHVTSWSNKGDVVMDPFCGSGTTGVAAVRMGRHFIGIEISPDHCKIAEKRIQEERDKYALFNEKT